MNSYTTYNYQPESSVEFPEESYFTSDFTESYEPQDPQPQPQSQPIIEKINIEFHIGPYNKLRTFPNIPVEFDQLSHLNVNDLFVYVQEQDSSINFENAQVSVFMPCVDMWIQLGHYPFKDKSLNVNNLYKKNDVIHVAFKLKYPVEEDFNGMTTSSLSLTGNNDESLDSEDGDKRRHRHKERMIGEACDLVWKWRSFYNGVKDPATGEIVKLGLEEGARRLGVAKKSLDDYLLMIKHAKERGFDFQKHFGDRFGILRNFVKERKEVEKREQKSLDFDDDDDNKRVKKVKKGKMTKSK